MFVADFETIVDINDCRIWAYAVVELENTDNIVYGTSLEQFFNWCKGLKDNSKVFFHNLKFDGSFLLDWLLNNGFTWVKDKRDRDANTFMTLISDGMFYDIEVTFKRQGSKLKKVTFRDSLKILPMSVDRMSKAFNLPISKLELDYKAYRAPDHILTNEEIEYIKNDVLIVRGALNFMFSQDMTKMTTASNALAEYKRIIGDKQFQRWFPPPLYDADVRQSYRGGFTWLNPKYRSKEIGEGIVLDVNSLYPSVMYYELLPYGEGIWYQGQYKEDENYPLYVQSIVACFELKKDHIPTLQLKNNLSFIPTEYITSSNDEMVPLCLTSIDLQLFLDHYDIIHIEYISGWKYKGSVGMFKKYIDKWSEIKIQSKIEGNGAMYQLSKLMLNSLYGKFGSRTKAKQQIPYLNEDGVVRFKQSDWEEKKPIYIPVATFITSYARNKTIRSAQKVYDRFIYADTDSLHLIGTEIPSELDVDETRLGAWDHENTFFRAKFIRAKCYLEDSNSPETWNGDGYDEKKVKITVAGMPSSCYKNVTYDNFRIGMEYDGKLTTKRVKGGSVLVDTTYKIKV